MLTMRKALRLVLAAIRDVTDGASLQQRADDGDPKGAGPAGHHHLTILEVHGILLG